MKRSSILPIGTPDEPRRPDRVEPVQVNRALRAVVWRAIIALLLAFWFGLAFVIGGGLWPW